MIAAFAQAAAVLSKPEYEAAAVKAADRLDPPSTSIFTPDTEFGSRLLVEVVRGCANLCRFCWAGYNYLPVRGFTRAELVARAREVRGVTNKIGLVSTAVCDPRPSSTLPPSTATRACRPRTWTSSAPGSGAGPAPDRLVLGSEGTLGVLTEAWVRLQDRPRFRASASVRFSDYFAAARCVTWSAGAS